MIQFTTKYSRTYPVVKRDPTVLFTTQAHSGVFLAVTTDVSSYSVVSSLVREKHTEKTGYIFSTFLFLFLAYASAIIYYHKKYSSYTK